MKKRLLSLMLAAAMTLSMGTVAFAEEPETPGEDPNKGKLVKDYIVENGTAPEETFTFKFEEKEAYNNEGAKLTGTVAYPLIDGDNKVDISFAEISESTTKVGDLNITIGENVALGKYIYTVTEVDNKTAGVIYNEDAESLYLVVTVERDEESNKNIVSAIHYTLGETDEKVGSITNKYQSGSLSVTKEIKGNMADMTKEFQFTITLNATNDEKIKSTVTYVITKDGNAATPVTVNFGTEKSTATIEGIMLGHGDNITFTNLPEGVTYTITEVAGEYAQTVTAEAQTDIDTTEEGINIQASGTINANDEDVVKYTNTLEKEVDTGISLDSMPYILMLAIVAVAAVMFFRKRRYSAM